MKIEYHSSRVRPYFTVLVDKDELELGNGRKMDFSTWLGVIYLGGSINLWTPACACPRGYKKAAKLMLERARDQLLVEGRI